MFFSNKAEKNKKKLIKHLFPFLIIGCWLALSQAPFSFTYLGLLALPTMAFFWLKFSESSLKSGLAGGVFGLGYFSITMLWIMEPFFVGDSKYLPWLAPFALFLVSIYLSFFWAVAFYLATFFGGKSRSKKTLNLIFFLTLGELGRSLLFGGFPWGLISHSLIDTPFAQLTSVFGPYFLVFFVYLFCFSMVISKSSFFYSLVMILLLYFISFSMIGYKLKPSEGVHNVKLIQPNIEQKEKWNEERFDEFYNRYIALGTKIPVGDIVILPETVLATNSKEIQSLAQKLSQDLNNNVIIGVRRLNNKERKLYNSILFINNAGAINSIYDKQHLVPFGEYFPFLNLFISERDQKIYGFSKGNEADEIEFLDMPTVLPAICYEIIFSVEIGERFQNAEWILNLTNDAWFGDFSGPQQHLNQAKMRAIELGIPIIRVANTGITAVILPDGSISDFLPLNKIGSLNVTLPAKTSKTIYSVFGPRNWLLLLIMVSFFCLIVINYKKFSI